MNRLLISGTNSGCGKTTVTCAILAALKARGLKPAAFKCGPDYIDPMFHRSASGIAAYNLDPFFLDAGSLRSHLALHGGDFSVIEGAMGYYDGIAATEEASAYTVARGTGTPVILTVGAGGASCSLGAVIEGFLHHRPENQIAGVIFDNAGEKRFADLEKIAGSAGLRAYGYLPGREEFSVPARHLGLYKTDELADLKNMLSELGKQAEFSLDIDGLIALSQTAPILDAPKKSRRVNINSIRLAVAKDEAFCFQYQENLELLKALGCELLYFSPIRDKQLPDNIKGLYLCGGYPELYAEALSGNAAMRNSIRLAAANGLPVIAEGGGFIYLHEELDGAPMCGVIKAAAFKTNKLRRFGYSTLTAKRDNLLCKAGEIIPAHEFHYWDSDNPGDDFTAKKAGRDEVYSCVHANDNLFAGFPQLYFPANESFAERFVERMNIS